MQMRSFTATDMKEAMNMARAEMGDNAVMLSTDSTSDGGVVVTFALDRDDDYPLFEEQEARPTPDFFKQPHETKPIFKPPLQRLDLTTPAPSSVMDTIKETLLYHSTPQYIVDRMLEIAQGLVLPDTRSVNVLQDALDRILKTCFRFDPLPIANANLRVILVGPPGMGKTITAAKIAAKIVVDNRDALIVTTDNNKAASFEQLSAFSNILGLDTKRAQSRDELRDIVRNTPSSTSIIIDSAGCNPYDFQELKALGDYATLNDIEPVLVCSAGIDPGEAEEIASVFSFLDIERILISRSDCARRFGSILAAATAGDYALCNVSGSPKVMGEFHALDPTSLSQLLTHYQRERTAA